VVATESLTSELCCLLPLSSGNETVRHTVPIPICFGLKSPSHIDSTETRQERDSVDPEEVYLKRPWWRLLSCVATGADRRWNWSDKVLRLPVIFELSVYLYSYLYRNQKKKSH